MRIVYGVVGGVGFYGCIEIGMDICHLRLDGLGVLY